MSSGNNVPYLQKSFHLHLTLNESSDRLIPPPHIHLLSTTRTSPPNHYSLSLSRNRSSSRARALLGSNLERARRRVFLRLGARHLARARKSLTPPAADYSARLDFSAGYMYTVPAVYSICI